MWIRPVDITNNPNLRSVLQLLLRTHGFVWYHRHRMVECDPLSIMYIRLDGPRIVVYHTFDYHIQKTETRWTRIKIRMDIDTSPIIVHMMEWPLAQTLRDAT